MPILYRDIETRSTLDLPEVGTTRYAGDPSTDVWCVCFAIDDGPAQTWIPGQAIPEEFHTAARDPSWLIVAHNDAFERAIEEHILAPRYGWPIVPIERHCCTMAMALAAALPAALSKVAEVLELSTRKGDDGARLMKQMARPRKPRADEDPAGTYWHDDPEKLDRLYSYCRNDVEVERELYHRLPPLADSEQALWVLDATINSRGFHTDGALLEAASRIAAAAGQTAHDELTRITNGALTSTDQVAALQSWLGERGCEVKDVRKPTLRHALRRKDLDPIARRVIELRLGAAHAAAAKIDTLLAWRNTDGRVRGTLRYHGAGTGRWTGHGPQPQNFKRDGENIDAKREAIATGDLAHVQERYPQPLEAVGDIARAMICAAPGHRFLVGDFSGIESRVLAWVSGQQSKLDQWAKFDRTGDPKDEPYYILGRQCGQPEESARKIGKTADLAFGYMGGPGAWDRLAPEDDTTSEADKKRYQHTWRRAHPQTVQFWSGIDRAAITAVRKQSFFTYKQFSLAFDGTFLRIVLPSGRALSYPFPRLDKGKFGDPMVMFRDNAAGKWVDCRYGQGAYGGLWAENITQAVSRDLLAAAMMRLEAAGYAITLHVHDEIVAEAPIGFGSIEEFERLIIALPEWADGLPIAAKVRNGERFSKSTSTKNIEESRGPTLSSQPDAAPIPDQDDEKANGMDNAAGDSEDSDTAAERNAFDELLAAAYHAQSPDPAASESGDENIDDEDPADNGTAGTKATNGSGGNGSGGSPKSNYHNGGADKDANKPYPPVRAALLAKGYRVAQTFPFTVPGAAEPLFYEDRYELKPGLAPTKSRPRKTCRFWHRNNGHNINGTGPRRIIYNWPAIMAAGPGATVFITEGANKSAPLNDAGLLATAAPYHKWEPECISALAGDHLIYLEDHDLPDERGCIKAKEFSAAARNKLAPVAASFRLVPALHLWKKLNHTGDPPHGWDVKNWIEAGGDPAKLLEICREISPESNFSTVPLTIDEWLGRDLPSLDPLIGSLFSTTTRGLLAAPTGIGKTNFGMALWGHAGLGKDFLHWSVPRPCRMLFIDGEMSRRLLRERIEALTQHLKGKPELTLFFNKEDIEGFAPLNTSDGQAAVWKLIEEVERRLGGPLDAICFDNIVSLLVGDMKEEDAWRDTMPMVRALTKRRIGQLWLHHTGHDTSRGYGTKTREWQLDLVLHLTEVKRPDTDVSFTLSFPKARERTPDNRDDFTAVNIALVDNQWIGEMATTGKERPAPLAMRFFEALQTAASSSKITNIGGYPTASLDAWQAQCVANSLIDPTAKPHAARSMFSKYKLQLIAANWIAANTDTAWILP